MKPIVNKRRRVDQENRHSPMTKRKAILPRSKFRRLPKHGSRRKRRRKQKLSPSQLQHKLLKMRMRIWMMTLEAREMNVVNPERNRDSIVDMQCAFFIFVIYMNTSNYTFTVNLGGE
jgi:hypothetical protein